MPLYKCDDFFEGNPFLCSIYVELMLKQLKKKRGEAEVKLLNKILGVWNRNNLKDFPNNSQFVSYNMENLSSMQYNPDLEEFAPKLGFQPLTPGKSVMKLPADVKVTFVGSDEDVPELEKLKDSPLIGLDAEWRPAMTQFDSQRVGLFQISDHKNAYLIDMIALAASKKLDETLSALFSQVETLFLGFSFHSDMSMFERCCPNLQFYKCLGGDNNNLVDLQREFKAIIKDEKTAGLAKVVETVFSKPLCKGEQMSNWELRPLRKTQQHYAALDAYCLTQIARKLAAKDEDSYLSQRVTSADLKKVWVEPPNKEDVEAEEKAAVIENPKEAIIDIFRK